VTLLNVCFPTLKRYDLLRESIETLERGEVRPTDIWVIDNGGGLISEPSLEFVGNFGIKHHYVKFGYNLGCAASWNWFAKNVPDQRIISNDDIRFQPDTLKLMSLAYDDSSILSPVSIIGSNSFSCFTLPTKLYESVGEFDEKISPNYAYFEDVDYSRRLRLAGFNLLGIPSCYVGHFGSSTLKSYTESELAAHHKKFRIARDNYVRKWGGAPGEEAYLTPLNV
jgi:GT2 family glycosyltransferase